MWRDGSSLYGRIIFCEVHTDIGSARRPKNHGSLSEEVYAPTVGFVQFFA